MFNCTKSKGKLLYINYNLIDFFSFCAHCVCALFYRQDNLYNKRFNTWMYRNDKVNYNLFLTIVKVFIINLLIIHLHFLM